MFRWRAMCVFVWALFAETFWHNGHLRLTFLMDFAEFVFISSVVLISYRRMNRGSDFQERSAHET